MWRQVADLMGLEVAHMYSTGVEFGGIGRQPFHHDASISAGHVVLNQAAAVDRAPSQMTVSFPGTSRWGAGGTR